MRGESTPFVLRALAAVSLTLVACALLGGAAAAWTAAVCAAAFPVLLIALGASRSGAVGPLRIPLVVLLFLNLLGWAGLYFFSPSSTTVAGFPLSALFLAVWLGLAPLVGLTYAVTFDFHGPPPEPVVRTREPHGS